MAIRAGTAIRCLWMVAVVALARNMETMAPAAQVRLNATAASTSQSPLAENAAEVGGLAVG